MAAQHGLAVSICECPWARRYGGLDGDVVEYNTGVIFFNQKSYHVFDAWDACGRDIDSSILFYQGTNVVRMPFNDQAGFAKAIIDTGFNPYVLPYNWNFRPMWHRTFWGPIKIWHDYSDPPAEVVGLFGARSLGQGTCVLVDRAGGVFDLVGTRWTRTVMPASGRVP